MNKPASRLWLTLLRSGLGFVPGMQPGAADLVPRRPAYPAGEASRAGAGADLFSLEGLEQHARDIATRHAVATDGGSERLLPRLHDCERTLRNYDRQTRALGRNRVPTPAAEWLLDNFHLIEEHIQMVKRHLPRGFSRELPHLRNGPLSQHPRVYELAVELIAHVDGRLDAEHLNRFVAAFQSVSPLHLGELWATPIALRLALIENLARIARVGGAARQARDAADGWAQRLLQAAEKEPGQLIVAVGEMAREQVQLTAPFVTEFRRRAQENSAAFNLAGAWIEERLAEEGLTIEHLVHLESQSQAAHQVSVGNTIASLRFIDATDWRKFVEGQSAVEACLREDPSGVYPRMDFSSRDAYRHVVERLARRSSATEPEVARRAISLAGRQFGAPDDRRNHVGYYLVDRGLDELERSVGARPRPVEWPERFLRRFPLLSYVCGILVLTAFATIPAVELILDYGAIPWSIAVLTLLFVVAASQFGVALINGIVAATLRPRHLPRLDFSAGIPPEHRTMVVVPTLLTSPAGIDRLIESLEVHWLANRGEHIHFALLTDLRDAPEQEMPEDGELIRRVVAGVEALNARYPSNGAHRFHLFHRPRQWNEVERAWMGHERKRGKLADLNRCLLGGSSKNFSVIVGDLRQLPKVRYVITLDTDTQLPRDTARLLAGSMAHPLNRPLYDANAGRVVTGYGILQPRVAVCLPSAGRSRFARLFSGDPGIDPYTRMVSDVYQDLFDEGSYIGKGIYDVEAFEQAAARRFPENRILSHDLLEGTYARSALVTDVLLFEEFPARYTADTRRRHRWMRGDWQIATWLLPRVPGPDVRKLANPISGLSRWKIFDNLRRSLVPVALTGLLVLGWLLLGDLALAWTGLVLLLVVAPALFSAANSIGRHETTVPLGWQLRAAAQALSRQALQAALAVAFLPFDTWVSLDAMCRSLVRLVLTRRRLLEWQTASDTDAAGEADLGSYLRAMWAAPALALVEGAALAWFAPGQLPGAFPLLLAWLAAPGIAWWISQPPEETGPALSEERQSFLRRISRRTWAYFETFVNETEHWLPPDNFQEIPQPTIATRTSPTNVGMALLGNLAAWDFGFVSTRQLLLRTTRTLDTLDRLERHRGHLYNWYDTRTLQPLPPLYVSTVDNGNFAGLLMTLRAGLGELAADPCPPPGLFAGLADTVGILQEIARQPPGLPGPDVSGILHQLEDQLRSPPGGLHARRKLLAEILAEVARLTVPGEEENEQEFRWWRKVLEDQCREQLGDLDTLLPWLQLGTWTDPLPVGYTPLPPELLRLWSALDAPALEADRRLQLASLDDFLASPRAEAQSGAMTGLMVELRRRLTSGLEEVARRRGEIEVLCSRCDSLAEQDFTLLYDRTRELFSIGYNAGSHRLDPGCYDLLASESRLTSFVAIALGQVPQEHWFTLGRLLTAVDSRPALISWSGSMFEYLMPPLIMPSYDGTLLDVSARAAVALQIDYAKRLGVPWGISESGYNAADAQANFQYRAFGVPGLGFKRGLAEDLVIAPYASAMALITEPVAACENLQRLVGEGALGRHGFYEALDYTASRVPPGRRSSVVRSFMAHHAGMTLLALDCRLLDAPMQRRFLSHPAFRAAELLLQERVPRDISFLHPHHSEPDRGAGAPLPVETPLRVFRDPNAAVPEVHLLSNGRYHVMLTSAGSGYSRWNDVSLTRWREDPTRDCWGTFLYLRETSTGEMWSAAYQPMLQHGKDYEAIFGEGRAEFRMSHADIESHTEISVSPEDDVEVRRITLTNHANSSRTIELTSFAEVVLSPAAADLAHPAFNKLFVQTEILRPQVAVACSRRPRSPGEQPPWMFHRLGLVGTEDSEPSFETDRARFLGRGGSAASPMALQPGSSLSGTEGAVIDPIIAIRRTVRLQPGETARLVLVAGSAPNREALLGLIEKYGDQAIADRVFELAWTHGMVTLRHLNATEGQAQLFGRLAGALLYSQPHRRAHPGILARNQRGQRSLWPFGVSGDLPILLARVTQSGSIDFIRQLLQAHAYYRLKGLPVDLVILDEEDSVYDQSFHNRILALAAGGSEAHLIDKPGGIFVRRTAHLSPEDMVLLQTAARVVLSDEAGTLADQLQRSPRREAPIPALIPTRARPVPTAPAAAPSRELLFFNGLGGFAPDGREYVIQPPSAAPTPAPWANVIANPGFGTLVTESGGSYTWAENCHEFRLTPWHNDPVTDLSGEAVYLRDEETGRYWSPTPQPARGTGRYATRHGFGYSVFEHVQDGIESELWVFVAADAPVKFLRVILRNRTRRARTLSVFGYWEWVLGELRERSQLHVTTEFDPKSGALLARNPYNTDFENRVAFACAAEAVHSWTTDRQEFLGRNQTLANPAALGRLRLAHRTGTGLDACAALHIPVTLAAGAEHEVVFRLGVGRDRNQATHLLQRFRRPEAGREALAAVRDFWQKTLGALQIETPDPTVNLLVNGWLPYQVISCRLWARSGFYQSGGAYGFRDQLQDSMAVVHARPDLLREQLLRAAAHQFLEGDVQHWWHPPSDRGVRTHIADDYLWLPCAVCRYVDTVGDRSVLDELVPFLEGRPLKPEEEACYDSPRPSAGTATLYDHCVQAIRRGLNFGPHGLPLMGGGDWNDGMNRVGPGGKGESVWLGFFLFDVLQRFAGLADSQGDAAMATLCRDETRRLRRNVEEHGWDGRWYRRAYFDDGQPLGSATNAECQIDALPQAWAVLSGLGEPDRSRTALEAMAHRLVRREARLIALLDPPFDSAPLEPGYIKGYLPGVRENGGQYSHAAVWTVMAFAAIGDTERAWDLFQLINPIRHGASPSEIALYRVEPYVMAADVYSVAPNAGRGGWSWYTGSAGWMYRLLLETFLGFRRCGTRLEFEPRLPVEWKSAQVDYRHGTARFRITLRNQSGTWRGPCRVTVEGVEQPQSFIELKDQSGDIPVEVAFG